MFSFNRQDGGRGRTLRVDEVPGAPRMRCISLPSVYSYPPRPYDLWTPPASPERVKPRSTSLPRRKSTSWGYTRSIHSFWYLFSYLHFLFFLLKFNPFSEAIGLWSSLFFPLFFVSLSRSNCIIPPIFRWPSTYTFHFLYFIWYRRILHHSNRI